MLSKFIQLYDICFIVLVGLLAIHSTSVVPPLTALLGSANNNQFCKYEWQGTAPTCEHGGYCDNGLIWVKDAKSCSGADCKNADFGSGCWTGNKALCQKTCNPISESACYLSCDVSPPCVNEVTSVSVTPVLPYPTKPKAMYFSGTLMRATVKAINYGSVSQTVTVTFAFQYQVTNIMVMRMHLLLQSMTNILFRHIFMFVRT